MDEQKKVGQGLIAANAAWTFENTAGSFDEHVSKSIPFYSEGQELICQLSDFFLHEGALVTELGSSTGALAERFLAHNAARSDLQFTGVDFIASMVEKASDRCADDSRARFLCEDVLAHDLQTSAMVISYYTIQFIHPRVRQGLFNRIYERLEWGGAFILFEKVRGPDARFQDITSQIYLEHKLRKEFSEAEILNKQRSLKGILEPFSTRGNLDLLTRAGFVDMMTIMKWVCFEGFLAIK
jgi:tRNA (cmo5U34)-methyltransferase